MTLGLVVRGQDDQFGCNPHGGLVDVVVHRISISLVVIAPLAGHNRNSRSNDQDGPMLPLAKRASTAEHVLAGGASASWFEVRVTSSGATHAVVLSVLLFIGFPFPRTPSGFTDGTLVHTDQDGQAMGPERVRQQPSRVARQAHSLPQWSTTSNRDAVQESAPECSPLIGRQ